MTRTTAVRGRSATGRLAVVLAVMVACSPVARADETSPPAEPPTTWYGWETLLADTGASALWVAAAVVDDAKYTSGARQGYETAAEVLIGAGFVAYGLGGPLVHLANGHGGKAAGSLGLRVGLPVGGALAAVLIWLASRDDDEGDVPLVAVTGPLGFIIGGVAAMAIDAAVIARGPATPAANGSRLQAVFVPTGGGGTFVVGGRF